MIAKSLLLIIRCSIGALIGGFFFLIPNLFIPHFSSGWIVTFLIIGSVLSLLAGFFIGVIFLLAHFYYKLVALSLNLSRSASVIWGIMIGLLISAIYGLFDMNGNISNMSIVSVLYITWYGIFTGGAAGLMAGEQKSYFSTSLEE